jgi:diguanylate cyclase (GGDEF)-like protein
MEVREIARYPAAAPRDRPPGRSAGAPAAPPAAESKEVRLQRHRLRMTLLTVVNSTLQSGIVALFAFSGATGWAIAAAFAICSIGSTGLFALGVAGRWLLRLGDARLVHAQIAVNFIIQMVFLEAAPSLWLVFLTATLITCSYAMVAFTPRQFTWLWLAYGAVTAAGLYAGHERFASPEPSTLNIAILWLFFFLGVRRLALTGAQFSRLREQLYEKNKQLTALLERNEALASRDELTGAWNRRQLMALLGQERERMRRTGEAFSVAIFDLDHFKVVNDTFGHAGGDAVLKRFCALVEATKRGADLFARYGGEEFVLLMPATASPEQAAIGVERIRCTTMEADWSGTLQADHRVTVSAGVATCRPDESVDELLARADAALYAAKSQGRNRVTVAEARPAPTLSAA